MSESTESKDRQDNARIAIADDRLDQLIQRAQEVIAKDNTVVPDFWKSKYKKEAAKNWDLFYKRNTTKFFKGRYCFWDIVF
jgi:methyltransferase-like protein 6